MGLIIIPGRDDPEPEPGHDLVSIQPEQIAAWVKEAIANNKGAPRTTRAQEIMDRAVEGLDAEGEPLLAAGLLMLSAARASRCEGLAVEALMQTMVDMQAVGALARQCRACGCTDDRACPGGCSWVEFDLCSRCAERIRRASSDAVARASIDPDRAGRDS